MKKQLQNQPDIIGLMTKIQEQIAALDRKVESLMNKSVPQPVALRPFPKPAFPQPIHAQAQRSGHPNDHYQGRPMHRATCADCKKECELPFKPSGDRPVYCKECFSRRKAGNVFKAPDNKPKELPSAQAVIPAAINVPQPPAKEKKKPAAAKKSGGKKNVVAKKKKK